MENQANTQSSQVSQVFQTQREVYNIRVPQNPYTPRPPISYRKQEPIVNSNTDTRIESARAPRRINYATILQQRKRNPANDILIHEKSNDIQRITTQVLMGDQIDEMDPQLLGLVALNLQNRRKHLETKGQFKDSIHVQQCIDKVREAQLEANKLAAQRYALIDIDLRKSFTDTDSTINEHVYEADLAKLDVRYKKLEEELKNRQLKELEEHDLEWNSEAKTRQYSHLSSNLQNLRDMHAKLVKAKRYEEANIVENEANIKEDAEMRANMAKRDSDYQRSYDQLLEKHRKEIEQLKEAKQSKVNLLTRKSEINDQIIENRRRMLRFNEDIAMDKEKLWKLRHRTDRYNIPVADLQGASSEHKGITQVPKCKMLKLPPLVTKSMTGY